MKASCVILLGLVLAAAGVGGGARAQSLAPAEAAAAPDPERLALARRIFEAAHIRDQLKQMTGAMMPAMLQAQARAHPNLTPEQQRDLAQIVIDVQSEVMMPRLLDALAPAYARTFSLEELRTIDAFYESPAGQAIVAKGPQIFAQLGPAMRDIMPAMQAEIARRACLKFDCHADRSLSPKS